MPKSLSFASDFFSNEDNPQDDQKVKRPKTVRQALASMPEKTWNEFCRDVLNTDPDYVDLDMAMLQVVKVDTCSSEESPVEVWLDEEGYYRVLVYD